MNAVAADQGGAWLVLHRTILAGLDYEHRRSAFRGGTALRLADAYVDLPLYRRVRLQVTGSIGFSRTAADRSLGFGLVTRL